MKVGMYQRISCFSSGYGSNSAGPTHMWQPVSSGYWYSGTGVSSDTDSSSFLPSLPYPSSREATELAAINAGPGSYSSSLQDFYSSTSNNAEGEAFDSGYAGNYGSAYAASQSSVDEGSASHGSYDGPYNSPSWAYVEDNSYGFVAAPQAENWSSGSATNYGTGDENPEPVFSDVSDLEPVFSFSSRSSYQRGRALFAQTRYTPGGPVPPIMPASRHFGKTVSKQSRPATTSTKGGF